jgi:hypothetical protein
MIYKFFFSQKKKKKFPIKMSFFFFSSSSSSSQHFQKTARHRLINDLFFFFFFQTLNQNLYKVIIFSRIFSILRKAELFVLNMNRNFCCSFSCIGCLLCYVCVNECIYTYMYCMYPYEYVWCMSLIVIGYISY